MKKQRGTQATAKQSNQFYIHGLKTQCSKGVEAIYRDHFPLFKNMIIKFGGDESGARDAFQEGLIIIFSKVQADTLTLTCSFRTYLFQIARKIWLKSMRQSGRAVNLEDFSLIPEDNTESEQRNLLTLRKNLLWEKISLLKPDDQKLLKLFFSGKSMKEIARQMGYASDNYAKKKKNAVKNRLVDLVRNDGLFKELSY